MFSEFMVEIRTQIERIFERMPPLSPDLHLQSDPPDGTGRRGMGRSKVCQIGGEAQGSECLRDSAKVLCLSETRGHAFMRHDRHAH